MPRITLGDRLQTIVDSPYLPPSKLNFAKSLLVFYQRKGMLTKGRRVWVDNFEEMIERRSSPVGNWSEPPQRITSSLTTLREMRSGRTWWRRSERCRCRDPR